jgi:ABC-type uncharacterized transport system involved in gliding motility auxiliary subunit
MKAWELVVGKFLASLLFFILTLGATVTIPVMLMKLGTPDVGVILSSYFGTVLLGAYFLSIGIFFSGFFKDQILSFIVTLLVCFAIYMLGTGFIAAKIDDFVPGLGSLLYEVVGLTGHYTAFIRGVIEMADIIYFIAWTILFLVLNVLYIDGRSRKGAKLIFSTSTAIALGIGLMGNWLISDVSLGRFDVTEDKIFTVSDASKNILSTIDTPVQVKLYMSPKADMPTGMNTLEQDITDKLEELRVASGGKIEYTTINLNASQAITSAAEAEEEADGEMSEEEEAVEKRLLDKGITPFTVQAMSEDQMTNKLVYSSIGIAYKTKKEEILPQIMPGSLPDLEYQLVSTIYKLTEEKSPVVALVAPKEAINIPPDLRRMYEQMGQPVPEQDDPYEILQQFLEHEKYEVHRVELTPESSLPAEYDTLVVVNPRSFNERQRWEINRALTAGKSVILAVQNYEWNYTPTRQGLQLDAREEEPQINPLLEKFGLGVDDNMLMDTNVQVMNVQTSNNPLMGMSQPVEAPFQMLVMLDTMDKETSITSRLTGVFYLWGTALNVDEAKLKELGLSYRTLMSSTEGAWKVPFDMDNFNPGRDFEQPEDLNGPYPLMAMIEGQFPDTFAETGRPVWPVPEPEPGQLPPPPPPEEADAAEITPAPGQLVLLGCSEMFRRSFIQGAPGNLDLFMNAVDAVTLGDDLVNVRGRKPILRAISQPDDKTRSFWKIVNYGLASSIIALVGIVSAFVRRSSRNAYTLSQMNQDN